jgi:hypothetical protein
MENIVRLKLSIAHTNTTGSATEKELAARLTHWQEPMMWLEGDLIVDPQP